MFSNNSYIIVTMNSGNKLLTEKHFYSVILDIKIFGLLEEDWSEALCENFEQAVWAEIPSGCAVPRCAVSVVQVQEISGENLRRVAEKVDRRAKMVSTFREHLENLVREDGGVINVKTKIFTPATAEAAEIKGRYLQPYPPPETSSVRRLITLDITHKEAEKAQRVAKALSHSLLGGTLQMRVRDTHNCKKAFSLTHNHIPSPHKEKNTENYALVSDTPRGRRSYARRLLFQSCKLIATGTTLQDNDVNLVNHRQDFEGVDSHKSRFIHPAFWDRRIEHLRPDVRKVNPIFWGQWSCPTVQSFTPELSKLKGKIHHLAFSADERDYVKESDVLHAEIQPHAPPINSNPKVANPMFLGYYRCGGDYNQLDHESELRRLASEEAEADADEAFVRMLARRNQRSSRVKKDDDEEERIRKWVEATKKRNLHPAIRGYKNRKVPIFASDAAQRIHPSCFGYSTGSEQILEDYPVTHVVHPACVGYELASQEPNLFTNSASKVLNPIFHGLSLHKGPRYEPPIEGNDLMAKRKLFLESLTSNPVKKYVPLCVVCFGENSEGCPRCWVPDKWEASGGQSKIDDAAGEITQAIMKDPILNRSRLQRSPAHSPKRNAEGANRKKGLIDGKASKEKRAKRFKLKMAAREALMANVRLISCADIDLYRRTKATYTTIYIKSLPTGEVTRLQMETSRTVRDLYFLYRSNARREVACLPDFWLLMPLMSGLMCLDDTRQIQDEMNCAFEPGTLTLEQYGMNKKDGEICLFQIKDLYYPAAGGIVFNYIAANVNLARKLDFESMEDSERQESEVPTRVRKSKFEEDKTSSVSIKTRINAMRISNAKEANDILAGGPGAQKKIPRLNAEMLKAIKFELLFRPDQLPPPVPEVPYTPKQFNVANDHLQIPLIREMRDVLQRQKQAWREYVKERERLIKEARETKLLRVLQQRREHQAHDPAKVGRKVHKAKTETSQKGLPKSAAQPTPPKIPPLYSSKIVFTDDC